MDAHDNKKALSELQLANEPLKIEPYELNIPMLKSMMTHDALNNLHTISKDWMPDMRVVSDGHEHVHSLAHSRFSILGASSVLFE